MEALLGLVEEGDLKPTAKAISERAGISRRSVFQHFADVEAIYEAASKRTAVTLVPLLRPVDATLPLAERIEALVAVRRRLIRTIDPIAQSARLREPFSDQLRASRRRLSSLMREQCRDAVAPELAPLCVADADELVNGIAGALSWSLYNHLRADLELGDDEAIGVMTRLVHRLLDVAPRPTVDVAARH